VSVIATAVKHLLAAGVTGDALVDAIAEMEAAQPKDATADRRRAWDRERKRQQREMVSGGIPPESADNADSDEAKEIPPKPPKENTTPQISPKGDTTPQAANDENQLKPEHVVEVWNDMAGQCGLPKVKDLNSARRRRLQTLIRRHSVQDFTEAIGAIERSPWMHGGNDRGWRADFDFLINPTKFTRLIEGSYDQSAHR
jgi:hypothetical protein